MAEVTYLEALRQGLWEEMERDERVFILGEDVGAYGGAFKVTEGFRQQFGEARVIDTPISEAAIVGAAAGAAHMGLRPVARDAVHRLHLLRLRHADELRRDRALPRRARRRRSWCAGPCGGYVRGGPFHSQNPEAAFLHTPGLKIVYPATARDAKGLIKSADPRRRSGPLPRAQVAVPAHQGGAPRGRGDPDADRRGAARARGTGPVDHHLRRDGVEGARGGRAAGAGGRARRSRCSTCARCCRSTTRRSSRRCKKTNKVLIVHEDTRTGGVGGRDHRADQRAGVRVAGRADHAGHGARRAAALRADAGGLRAAADGRHREGGEMAGEVLSVQV